MHTTTKQPQKAEPFMYDWYAYLGIPRDASPDAINEALTKQLAAVRPSRYQHMGSAFGPAAKQHRSLLRRAKKALTEKKARAAYDATLSSWTGPLSADGMRPFGNADYEFLWLVNVDGKLARAIANKWRPILSKCELTKKQRKIIDAKRAPRTAAERDALSAALLAQYAELTNLHRRMLHYAGHSIRPNAMYPDQQPWFSERRFRVNGLHTFGRLRLSRAVALRLVQMESRGRKYGKWLLDLHNVQIVRDHELESYDLLMKRASDLMDRMEENVKRRISLLRLKGLPKDLTNSFTLECRYSDGQRWYKSKPLREVNFGSTLVSFEPISDDGGRESPGPHVTIDMQVGFTVDVIESALSGPYWDAMERKRLRGLKGRGKKRRANRTRPVATAAA